jgi:c(7)-type cytochrome triheme protein
VSGVRATVVSVGILVVLLGTAMQTDVFGVAELKGPPDFPFATAESSPGTVTFSHDKHRAKVDKCSTCHMKDFKMKRGASGPITLAAKQEGKYCGACHDGQRKIGGVAVFPIDECDRCHK